MALAFPAAMVTVAQATRGIDATARQKTFSPENGWKDGAEEKMMDAVSTSRRNEREDDRQIPKARRNFPPRGFSWRIL